MCSDNISVSAEDFFLGIAESLDSEKDWALKIPVKGTSMKPYLIEGRDEVLVSKLVRGLVVGDIVLYRSSSGKCVMHRVCSIGNGFFSSLGDSRYIRENNVPIDSVIGVVSEIYRDGVKRKGSIVKNFFYRKIWVRSIFLRRVVSFVRKRRAFYG